MDRVAPDPPFWRIHMQQERKIIMKKKSVSLLLALTLVFSLFPGIVIYQAADMLQSKAAVLKFF